VLSNHFHLVVTDPAARLPEFHRYLDGLVARVLNCSLGRWESFWDPDSYSAVRLESAEDVLEKIVYVLANPVAAGLVRHGHEWPGLWSDPSDLGGPALTVERPKEFFRDGGPMPASVPLRLHAPPGFEGALSSFRDAIRQGLDQAEVRAASDLAEDRRSPLGAARVRAQNPHSRPTTREPRRVLSPNVACRNKWRRVEVLLYRAEFREAYREALRAWKAHARDVLFPDGTWLMRVQHAVCCAPAH
jgi:hypothetical protein